MIYHFVSDANYGAPFIRVLTTFAQRHGVAATVVWSTLREPARRRRSLRSVARSTEQLVMRRLHPRFELPAIRVKEVNDTVFSERIAQNDIGIVSGFNQIFKADTLARFQSIVNIHPSVLPLYRGPTPVSACVRNGERMTGFTFHTVTSKIDSGPILYQEAMRIDGVQDVAMLSSWLAERGSHVLWRYLEHVINGGPWEAVTLDARAIYETHVPYASFS
ncbi:MAG: hypothetical protein DLM53_11050 [Candidatus Eremiobacter antarcticus]|nr:hypothetical protein [Candidatus Eremiobacteraeota bacterium]PZR60881.1 MAG: hypothetical protein DLM53_11050 [Candidatus Eremiobacter sp. RRmetagenome_bin22]